LVAPCRDLAARVDEIRHLGTGGTPSKVTSLAGYPGGLPAPLVIETQRDAAGNLTRLTHPDATAFTYYYDGLDQLTSEAVTSWAAYPGAAPLPVVGTTRDGEGNLTSLSYPSPTPLSLTYVPDDLDRLDEIRDGAGTTTLVDLTWSDLSQLSALDFVASGAGDVYQYDAAGRIDVITHAYFDDQAGALSAVLDYTLDPTGVVASIDGDEVSVLDPITYTYDDTKQLVRVDYPASHGSPDPVVQREYDAAGNRLQEVLGTTPGVDPTTDYVPNALNQYAMVGPDSRTFDANGNLTSDGSFTYHWDHENQLVEVRDTTDTTTIQSYEYDPFGRRIRKTDPTEGDLFFIWSGDRLLEERDGSADIAARYTYASGFAPVQVRYYDTGEVVYDVHADHLDTPRRLTDAAGEEVWRADYDAFGNAFEDLDPDGDLVEVAFNIRFPGQYFDAETGLHYNRFRYYDPSVGRYVSADPVGQHADPNLYTYVLNNPVSLIDPLGLFDIFTGFGDLAADLFLDDGDGNDEDDGEAEGSGEPCPDGEAGSDPFFDLAAGLFSGVSLGTAQSKRERRSRHHKMRPSPPERQRRESSVVVVNLGSTSLSTRVGSRLNRRLGSHRERVRRLTTPRQAAVSDLTSTTRIIGTSITRSASPRLAIGRQGRMDTWYLNLEGSGLDHPSVGGKFGFFVHCVVVCTSLEDARVLVREALLKDELSTSSIHHEGRLDDFLWDDPMLELKVRGLAKQARATPGFVATSDFESWPQT
jgi:RHS repeat-associated protein